MSFQTRAFRPRLEWLETRWCPAVDVSTFRQTMYIRGDFEANTVTIVDDGTGNVTGTIAGLSGTDSLTASGIQNIVVYGNDNDDVVSYDLTGVLTGRRALYVHLGNGNDQATFNFGAGVDSGFLYTYVTGSWGEDQVSADYGSLTNANVRLIQQLHRDNDKADVRFNGTVDSSYVGVSLNTGYEDDSVTFAAGDINNSRLGVNAWLAAGNDSIDATFSGAVLGSSPVGVATWDGYGNDTIAYHALGANVGAGANLGFSSYSSYGNDDISLDYQGLVDGRLGVSLVGGGLSDIITANITIDAGGAGQLWALVRGGWAPDTLTLNVFDNSGVLSRFFALLDGGFFGGNTCTHTSNVRAINC